MTAALLAFAIGVIILQTQASLPAPQWLWLLPICVAAAWWRRGLRVPAAFAVGFLWAALAAHSRIGERLTTDLEGRDLEVVGVVASLPVSSERGVRFEFEIESSAGGERLPRRVRLAWYREAQGTDQAGAPDAAPHPGERWRLALRLHRPHGNVNPAGFDYEAWLLERGIGATGYVRARPEPLQLGVRNAPLDWVERAREAVRDRFDAVLGATPATGILAALAVGDQNSIPREEWLLFQRTGVTHLMSISGLHVTLVSGLAAWCVAFLWRRTPRLASRLCHALPARKAAALAAIAAALGYSLLAGFAVPAQRTCYMVTVVALALWSGRIVSAARTLALALGVVLAADPWAPLSPGFWLSFGAVALIFYVAGGWSAPGTRIAEWARVQWAITVGLAPASVLLFSQVSLVGPLANAVAIPLVSGVITPLALAAALLPYDALPHLAARLVEWLLMFLEWCATLPIAVFERPAPPLWSVLLALAGTLWLLAPRGLPWRASGLVLFLPAFLLAAPAPAPGVAWVTVLDVGQGLAVLVRTANHALVYDTGPSYGPESDSGARVIVPLLRAQGVTRLDAMVVSHQDIDHLGGARSVLEALEVDRFISSLESDHDLLAQAALPRRCVRGDRWEWDGVRFELLHPASEDYARGTRGNNLSCVLRVSAGANTVLLTADIERAAESLITGREGGSLRADFLLVPHHGSRTSSSAAFLDAVAPRWAVVPAGYRNRFRHPNAEVLERYRARGTKLLRTDLDGAVTVRLASEGIASQGLEPEAERVRAARYWRDRRPAL